MKETYLDSIFFGIGMAFASPTTVLPSFVSQLTDSPPLVGLVLTIQTGAWLLPQLIAANYLADKARKKPYLSVASRRPWPIGPPAVGSGGLPSQG